MTDDLARIGDDARKLTAAFAAHRHDAAGCDFANSIFAVYGMASPTGRAVDRSSYLNSYVEMVLGHDFPWIGQQYGWWPSYTRPRGDLVATTQAAKDMKAHALRRDRGRKVPSSPATDRALRAYAAERLDLIKQAETLFKAAYAATKRQADRPTNDDLRRWTAKAAKERKAAERLLGLLPGLIPAAALLGARGAARRPRHVGRPHTNRTGHQYRHPPLSRNGLNRIR